MTAGKNQATPESELLSRLRGAARTIKELERRLAAAESAVPEPIAVLGVGCRFPGGATDPDRYWELLREGRDAISEIPADRWDDSALFDLDPDAPGKSYSRWMGALDDVARFDAALFGISPREARCIDPQQRQLLEVAWHALEHAGWSPLGLEGENVGVFVGIGSSGYTERHIGLHGRAAIDAYVATGAATSAAVGRISYQFGFRGPCVALDTACSSSLVAVHLAAQSLGAGECDVALAGGVNLILSPEFFVALSKARMLAPDGRCKTFSDDADGYVRGEGCGLVVLKRLADALRDGDRPLAILRGSAINQDGRSSGLTAPNGPSQAAVIRAALARAKLAPAEIGFVETHGSGTRLGDPIEVNALAEVYGQGRDPSAPLWLGGVKANIGHLELAAGIAGFIKAVLAVHHGEIPPQIHVRRPNRHIAWGALPVAVPSSVQRWTGPGPRRAGVSAFGFSGTNAHVILEAPSASPPSSPRSRSHHLFAVSAHGGAALEAQRQQLALALAAPGLKLADVCAAAGRGRAALRDRRVAVVSDVSDVAGLIRWLDDPAAFAGAPVVELGPSPRVGFLFTGQGSQYPEMARALFDAEPVFAAALRRFAGLLEGELARPLLELLLEPSAAASLDDTEFAQPALLALELALAELWRSFGVRPHAVLGHSLGEFAAAVVAGILPAEDALRFVARRGRLMQRLPRGAMLLVDAEAEDLRAAVAEESGRVSIAAVNGPGATVLSGLPDEIARLQGALAQRGVSTRPLRVSHAFHSAMMEPILDELARQAGELAFAAPQIPCLSNLTGRPFAAQEMSASSIARHARAPVLFARGVDTLYRELGCQILLELGPHPVLLGAAARVLESRDVVLLPSMRRDRPAVEQVLDSAGRLFVHGVELSWRAVAGSASTRVALPLYPFGGERHWLGDDAGVSGPSPSATAARDAGPQAEDLSARGALARPLAGSFVGPFVGAPLRLSDEAVHFSFPVSLSVHGYLVDHQILGETVVPGAFYLAAALLASRHLAGGAASGVRDVLLPRALVLSEPLSAHLSLRPQGQEHAFHLATSVDGDQRRDAWVERASGVAFAVDLLAEAPAALALEELRARAPATVEVADGYHRLSAAGLVYGPAFRGIVELSTGPSCALARVRQQPSAGAFAGTFHPATLDACLQTMAAALADPDPQVAYVPFSVGRLELFAEPGAGDLWCAARAADAQVRGDTVAGELDIYDERGRVVASVRGLTARRVRRAQLVRDLLRPNLDWLYQVAWRQQARPARSVPAGSRWALLGSRGALGRACAAALHAAGASALWLPDPRTADGRFDAAALSAGLQALLDGEPGLTGILDLTGASDEESEDSCVDARADEQANDRAQATLGCLQALCNATGPVPPVLVATRSAQQVTKGDGTSLAGAASSALVRTLGAERPELAVSLVDLAPRRDDGGGGGGDGDGGDRAGEVSALLAEASRLLDEPAGAAGWEPQVAYREGLRWVPRLVHAAHVVDLPSSRSSMAAAASSPAAEAESYRLVVASPGELGTLALAPAARRAPAPGEVELEVRALGLNFRDVLGALGMFPIGDAGLGSECAGVVVQVGEGVVGLTVGQRVVALCASAFARYVTTDARQVAAIPDGLSDEEAATIPMAFLTAWYGLHELGQLRPGMRVLVHAAAGGVGMAAVQLALRAGAQVFATASPAKHGVVRELGVAHVMSSRDHHFAEQLVELTGGQGIDLVLNSLVGPFIPLGLRALAPGGTFIEIGKAEIWDAAQVQAVRADVAYHAFDLAQLSPSLVARMFEQVLAGLRGDADRPLRPLPRRTFSLTQASEAFRTMAHGKHTGKLVLVPPNLADLADHAAASDATRSSAKATSEASIRAEGSYLVTGGAGAIGQQLASWLLARGAGRVVLVGRRSTEAAESLIAQDPRVHWRTCDVGDAAAVRSLLSALAAEEPPLRGILHAAGVLDDAPIAAITPAQWQTVWRPKVAGALHLHQASAGSPLELFVVFSSISALFGAPGQGSYAAANAALDGVMQRRRLLGLPALSVAWGPWAGGGMAGSHSSNWHRWSKLGVGAIPPRVGCELLGTLLEGGASGVAVMPMSWSAWRRSLPPGAPTPSLLSEVLRADGGVTPAAAPGAAPAVSAGDSLVERLRALGPQDRRARLRRVIAAEVGSVLGLSAEQLDSLRPLSEQGVDSLMAVEIRNALARLLGRPLPVTMVFDFPTLDALASRLADELGAPAAVAPPAVAAAGAEDDPLVIVGLGCHLPGGVRTPEELWQLLCEGQVAVEEVPPQRWDVDAIFDADPAAPGKTPSRWMGWLRGVDEFDPLYFEISPREAVQMDPQQRQLLETVVRACESGGLTRQRLSAARAAVFVGISGNEYLARHVAAGHATILDMFSGTGNTASVAAGRISYLLDLGGPSLALDTACSSSLVALHLACESVRRGEAHLALAAGVNLLLAPETTIAMSKLGALSPTGRCRPFDRRADGYVRSEGCVVVAVERLSEARKHGDVVFAVVRATAVNQDGRSNGLTAPNGLAQQDVMRRALERSGLRPDQIGYVEAHGTGTPLGDPIELQALQEVYGTRGADRPLLVGSLKANLGHMEAAAGLGGLLKVVLALQHGQIPPQPDALQPNPYIDWDAAPVQVAGSLVAWPGGGEVRRGAVSSFGFSGTNAHVILESAPPPPAAASPSTTTPDRAWLLPISARSPAALADLLRGYDGWLTKMAPSQLGDLCLTAALRRDHHAHRLAVCGASPAALQAAIRGALALGVTVPEGWMQHGEPPVFLFSGQGSQWPEMGRRLLAQEPVFAAAFDACGEALSAHLPWDARAVIEGRAAQIDRERADVVQPLLFALQVAFAALWRSWGIAPAGVVGHSLGEVAAAHVAGALGLEDAAQVISVRSKLLAGLEGEGRMAIVHLEAADAEALVARSAGRLCIAAYNGARSLVLSGQPDALAALVAELSGRNVFARFVGTRMAAHSPQVEPLLDELRARLAGVAPRATTIPFFSSVTGEVADGRALGPEYWAQNLRQPVRFRHSLASAVALGHRTFVELSPHPILLPALQADQDLRAEELVLLASGERDADERHVMLSSLAELYRRGALPRFDVALMPGGLEEVSAPAAGAAAPPWRVASLPRYPFQRARYWLSTPTAQAQRDTASLRDTYQVVWSESPPARGRGGEGAAADAPTFVLHARDHGAAAPLVAALERQGGRCRVWTAEPTPPAGELDGRQVIVELGLVEPISALEAEARTGGQMLEAVGARLTQALQAAQALARGPRAAQRLYWITRGAQAVGGQPVTAVQDSPLWGLGRVLALEHPELLAALIDLDPSASVADCWTQLAEELWRREALSPAPTLGAGPDAASDGEPASPSLVEDQLAFRSGRRYRARLRRLEQTLPAEAAPLQADASYLILGGLSFLGGQLARWWSQRGARHLILTTRGSAADAMTSQELSRRDDLLRDLAAAGVTVTLRSWDGLDEAALHALFDDAAAQGHPVRGVAHLAGASSVCALLDLGGDELRRVLAPKVAGAWALHRVTAGRSLDFFVLYSSAAGVWGAAGSGHYGAANQFLDALASHRRGLGLPATSVAWGRWPGGGLVNAQAELFYDGMGLEALRPEQAHQTLDALITAGRATAVVAAVRWDRFAPVFEARRQSPLLADLHQGPRAPAGPASASVAPGGGGELLRALHAAPAARRKALLVEQLRERIAAVVQAPLEAVSASQGFFALGMNSLMAVELGRQLAAEYLVKIPATIAFERPTVVELAAYLLESIASTSEASAPEASAPASLAPPGADTQGAPTQGAAVDPGLTAERLEELSEHDLAHLLAETLSEIEGS